MGRRQVKLVSGSGKPIPQKQAGCSVPRSQRQAGFSDDSSLHFWSRDLQLFCHCHSTALGVEQCCLRDMGVPTPPCAEWPAVANPCPPCLLVQAASPELLADDLGCSCPSTAILRHTDGDRSPPSSLCRIPRRVFQPLI